MAGSNGAIKGECCDEEVIFLVPVLFVGVNAAGNEELTIGSIDVINPVAPIAKISAPDDVSLSINLRCKSLNVFPAAIGAWDFPVTAYKDAIT